MSNHTEEEKEEIKHHLLYEFDMLVATANWLYRHQGQTSASQEREMTHNAILEAFLVHVRNWFDFLFPKNIQKDDVTVYDFVPETEWPHKLNDEMKKLRTDANKALFHITWTRLKQQIDWPYVRMLEHVFLMRDEFMVQTGIDLIPNHPEPPIETK